MRLLVTGAAGQPGRELAGHCADSGDDVVGLDRAQLDGGDQRAVSVAVAAHRPDVVVNAAAWTAVDACESDPDRAFRDNAHAVRWLREACDLAGAHLVQVSTDYVFGGGSTPRRHGNWYRRTFKPAVKQLVAEGTWPERLQGLRFHDLRHTCASLCIANGEHMKAISERLGHSSIAITMDRYGHLYEGHDEELVSRLDATFAGARNTPQELRQLQSATSSLT